ncbi:tryptophan-rich sensory protein [Dyadobacter sp. NIV53]|uniref:tryptophan-rich sensory protein n=1 Tax=Dyadobacter sp. NIV53 TaxID=2861765 RepID=UPI001C86FBD3|nr:tryptophan-rich sensory protein [Dyadobacter sp. NIV53]
MKKTLQAANILALIITIIMNYLSNTGVFNGNTMATVSARYQNLFTPSGYAFSIWGFIYIGLIAFVIHQGKGLFKKGYTPSIVEEIGWAFVISCVANCLWILAWLYEFTGASVLIMIVLLVSLLRIIILTRMELDLVPFKRVALVWWPFSLYLGWIMVAVIANTAAYLTKIEWNGFGISDTGWTIMMICVAGAAYLFITWNRNMREAAFVGAWGLAAVASANWNKTQSVAFAAINVTAILILSGLVHGYKNRKNPFII